MTRWQPTARDEHRALAYTIRLNVQEWWNRQGWWTHIMIGAGLLCAFELLAIRALYPHLLEAVAS